MHLKIRGLRIGKYQFLVRSNEESRDRLTWEVLCNTPSTTSKDQLAEDHPKHNAVTNAFALGF